MFDLPGTVEALVAGLLANLIGDAVGASRREPAGYPAGPEVLVDIDDAHLISIGDREAISDALASNFGRSIVRAYTYARALEPAVNNESAVEKYLEDLEEAFLQLVGSNNFAPPVERDRALAMWRSVCSQIDSSIENLRLADKLDPKELSLLASADPGTRNRKKEKIPRFLRDLRDLLSRPESISDVECLMGDIRRQYHSSYAAMRIEHSLDIIPQASLDALYVSRTVQDADGNAAHIEDLLSHRRRGRFVITGPPGAGKSTLTQHIVMQASGGYDVDRTPLLVRVREINADRPVIIEEIVNAVRRDLQLHDVDVDAVNAVLALGSSIVVFDGLDEAIDDSRRRSTVSAINAFASRYPLVTIFVTSRAVGYEKAPLGGEFERYELVEFSDEQIMDYAIRWFGVAGGGRGNAEALYRELESVQDIRRSPLMLSLICTLYRARGHVPRNRRQVYLECAELLFNRWDPMRKIDQPVDQAQYGQDLMQDIALWYFKSAQAQSGVEEAQLEGVVSHFFRDTAGVLPSEARRRARSFIEYCSGRAWLLSWVSRNAHGEKLYTFTHRTFMEYFAAEGLARTTGEPRHLAKFAVDAYRDNESSVVPELIVQSAEAVRRGQGRRVIEGVSQYERELGAGFSGRFLPLKIRLAAVLTLPPAFSEKLFEESMNALGSGLDGDSTIIRAMGALPKDQRDLLFAHLAGDSELGESVRSPEVRILWATKLLDAWSAEILSAAVTSEGLRSWRAACIDLWRMMSEREGFAPGLRSRTYFWRQGLGSGLARDELAAQLVLAGDERCSGRLQVALRVLVSSDSSASDVERASNLLGELPSMLTKGCVTARSALEYARAVDSHGAAWTRLSRASLPRLGLCAIAFMILESAFERAEEAAGLIGSAVEVDFARVAVGRTRGRGRARRIEDALSAVDEFDLPEWVSQWARGRLNLVSGF